MSEFNRVELQRKYVERSIDSMDLSDIMSIVSDHFHDGLEDLTDEEFIEEVKFYQPELLEEDE